MKAFQSTILLMIFIFMSCTKTDQITCGTSYLSDCLKPYMFDNNSYWIYQNTNSFEIDSTYVIGWEYQWVHVNYGLHSKDCDDVERITIDYSSSIREDYVDAFDTHYIFYTQQPYSAAHFYIEYVTYNCNEMDILDSLTITGNTYYNVKLNHNNQFKTSYYYADNIGIVRWIEYSNSDSVVYDLLRYDVTLFEKPE